MMDNGKQSFPPIINPQCEILILGSMPGEESLRKQQYYAFPRNSFWRIMAELFSFSSDLDYSARIKKLLDNKIALWDVLSNCEREGSLDSDIRKEKLNDFITLFNQYPKIKKVYFNGQKAFHSFGKIQGLLNLNIELKVLPSTSPAHAIPFEKKLVKWRVIRGE